MNDLLFPCSNRYGLTRPPQVTSVEKCLSLVNSSAPWCVEIPAGYIIFASHKTVPERYKCYRTSSISWTGVTAVGMLKIWMGLYLEGLDKGGRGRLVVGITGLLCVMCPQDHFTQVESEKFCRLNEHSSDHYKNSNESRLYDNFVTSTFAFSSM